MGLLLTNKKKDVSIGYFGFAFIRKAVANTYSKEIGILYDKLYNPLFKEYTKEENKYFDEHLPKYLDKFLFHSDCDGYLSARDVKGIYKELIKLKPTFVRDDFKVKYDDLLELFSQGERIDFY